MEKQDLFGKLPLEIVKEILLRLPVGSLPTCKCVCKTWLHILSSHHFLKSYVSKLAPLKAVVEEEKGSNSTWCEVFVSKEVNQSQPDRLISSEYDSEFELELEWEFLVADSSESESETESDSFSGSETESESESEAPLICFEIPGLVLSIEDSVNGFLFLSGEPNTICVCNPMTRELCRLQPPPPTVAPFGGTTLTVCGLGAGRITGQHKVVAFHRSEPACYVYTIGTRPPTWRRVEALPRRLYYCIKFGLFKNGIIYWLARDLDINKSIVCCFDVETECFSALHLPTTYMVYFESCEVDRDDRQFRVIKLYEEEGAQQGYMEFYHPDETTTDPQLIDMLYARLNDDFNRIEKNSMLSPPSFVSLKTLGMENVISF